jgi:hypothetical protein
VQSYSVLVCLLRLKHHDFGSAWEGVDSEHQGERFATLLLYLNKPDLGGQTSFPRWQNAEVRNGNRAIALI